MNTPPPHRTVVSPAGRHRSVGLRVIETATFVCALFLFGATDSLQQAPEPTSATAPTPDVELEASSPLEPPTPGGAFLRSLAVPGWGHAAIGSWGRAAVYATAQGLTWYTLVRTRLRLNAARGRADLRQEVLRERLARDGITDPLEVRTRLDADPGLAEAEDLVSARENQQEDWLALTIFLMLFAGADAYVSTHLKDFPDPIDVGAAPSPDGGVELFVRIPVGGR